MIERTVRFGPQGALAGILAAAGDQSDRPAVVFINSGLLHRVGASRIHVQLARALAAQGIPSLRFDLSGVGDSQPRRDPLPFEESARAETRDAIDLVLERTGRTSCVLVGLCSGADVAFWAAGGDERVTGLVQFDPFAYRTPGWYVRHYAPRLVDPGAWVRSVRGRLRNRRLAQERSRSAGNLVAPEYRRRFPPREEVEAGLGALLDRGVRLYCVFTGDMSNRINHESQFAAAFPALDLNGPVQVEFLPNCSHTFTGLGDQHHLQRAVPRWFDRHWPAGNPSVVPSK